MSELARIDILSFTVAVLGLLTTILIGWQIYQVVCVDRIVKRKIEKKIDEYDVVIEKKLAAQQAELLTALMTITLDSGNYNMTLLMASHIPCQMERAKSLTDENLKEEIGKIEKAISRADECGFQFSEHPIRKVIEEYEPYSKFPSVRTFLPALRQRHSNLNRIYKKSNNNRQA